LYKCEIDFYTFQDFTKEEDREKQQKQCSMKRGANKVMHGRERRKKKKKKKKKKREERGK